MEVLVSSMNLLSLHLPLLFSSHQSCYKTLIESEQWRYLPSSHTNLFAAVVPLLILSNRTSK
jgi:hypothetical protein